MPTVVHLTNLTHSFTPSLTHDHSHPHSHTHSNLLFIFPPFHTHERHTREEYMNDRRPLHTTCGLLTGSTFLLLYLLLLVLVLTSMHTLSTSLSTPPIPAPFILLPSLPPFRRLSLPRFLPAHIPSRSKSGMVTPQLSSIMSWMMVPCSAWRDREGVRREENGDMIDEEK